MAAAKLHILCLHGSRQDAEIFSSRMKVLQRKLSDVAVLHFVDAPHELPLQPGQEVAMRAWWRHWALEEPQPEPDAHPAFSTDAAAAAEERQRQQQHIREELAAGWQSRITADWAASLAALDECWQARVAKTGGFGFDGVLGFSNGAAAAFLYCAHAMTRKQEGDASYRSLRFAILASGYVAQPLQQLLPPGMVSAAAAAAASAAASGGEAAAAALLLAQPLPMASLHMLSASDVAVPEDMSRELSLQFDPHRKQLLQHELGHCVPQKAQHCDAVLDFISWFSPLTPAEPAPAPAPAPPAPSSKPAAAAAPPTSKPTSQAAPPPDPEPAPEAPAAAAVGGWAASQDHLDEMEALAAIFGDEYVPITTSPPRFRMHLREPGTGGEEEAGEGGAAAGPPSRLFSLIFTLPEAYPQEVPPVLDVEGPLAANDPRRAQLLGHLAEVAAEAVRDTGAGCAFQVIEAAKEWIDGNVPPDIGQRRAGGRGADAAGAADAAAAAAAAAAEACAPKDVWWEKEEADGLLVQQAIAAASAAHWQQHAAAEGATAAAAAAQQLQQDSDFVQRGRWDLCIGLVGKPSAGKSTFYNSIIDPATDSEGAKVGSFPFTTIQPNIGRGYIALPDPARVIGLNTQDCKPAHGYVHAFDPSKADPAYNNIEPLLSLVRSSGWGDATAWRKVPVIIKDVAGLVPGAYKGRGRGNAFLNDLCDADVLIHVVDASGSTNKEGQQLDEGKAGDPLEDIGWVREELHRWVYGNVSGKWAQVLRRPARLMDLFSGYHASRALIWEAVERCGTSPASLSVEGASVAHWREADLHKLVATFVQARFPILLALNKADTEAAQDHIRRIRTSLPHEPAVAVSAATERWLCGQRRAGNMAYEDASSSVTLSPTCQDTGLARQATELQRRVLARYGSTGALLAASAAVAMRPPRIVYPVSDLATCQAIPVKVAASAAGGLMGAGQDAKARAAEGANAGVLRDSVLLKPGSTVEDVYSVLKRPPYQLLEGDFVRAEALVLKGGRPSGAAAAASPSSHATRVLKKDEVVDFGTCVIRVMTNKRANWQKV